MMVAGNIPGKTQSIPIAIYFATQDNDMRTSLIWVTIIFVISLAVLVMLNNMNSKSAKKKLGAGGAKWD